MRPPGPIRRRAARSIPASRARRRLAGEVMTRPPRAAPSIAQRRAARLRRGRLAAPSPRPLRRPRAGTGAAAARGRRRGRSRPVSNTISGEPTATLSPGAPVIDSTRPLTGAGTSTAALSVITSTMI